jgi:hypothetical protein
MVNVETPIVLAADSMVSRFGYNVCSKIANKKRRCSVVNAVLVRFVDCLLVDGPKISKNKNVKK